jgi:hypothetical protein
MEGASLKSALAVRKIVSSGGELVIGRDDVGFVFGGGNVDDENAASEIR